MSRKSRLLIVPALLASAPLWAQQASESGPRFENRGWGLRFGLADDPDTAVFGGQMNLGDIVENLRLQPSFELGVGDDHTTLFVTGAMHYRFAVDSGFTPYAGGGPAVGFVEYERRNRRDDTEFEIGLRAVGGIEWQLDNSRSFFVELQLGFGDVSDAQITAGWFF